jgi:spore coat protein A
MHARPIVPLVARLVAAATLLLLSSTAALPLHAALLDAVNHPKFVNALPIAARVDAMQGGHFEMQINRTSQWLGLVGPGNAPLHTTVWGYGFATGGVSYPGPTFVTKENVPITATWNNNLPPYDFPLGPGAHLLPLDPTIHLAHPLLGGVPVVTHLHGGHTESASDGLPEAWYTQGFAETGPDFVKQTHVYDNDQQSATLWYHDHALGITRLNVYAGMAGFYLLRDKTELKLQKRGVLPSGPYEIEVAVQDRMFTDDGALFYPSAAPEMEPGFSPLPPGPSIIAEFFGDFILVNGGAWPYLDVEARQYRFRVLNGSDSRFYVFELRDHPTEGTARPFLQVGTDTGLLPKAVPLTRLLLGPGERADLVVDFSAFAADTELYLRNFGPDDPFKGFNEDGTLSDGAGGVLEPADPATTGTIMKFVVGPTGPTSLNRGRAKTAGVKAGTRLRPEIVPLEHAARTRQLVLFEGLDQYGRLQPLLGTLDQGSQSWFETITETPMLDDVEVWEVFNATEDAHPIHLHLISFQILGREDFEGEVAEKPQPQHDGGVGIGGVLTVTEMEGKSEPPAANEAGWKDTAIMPPGQVTRLAAKFDRAGLYVWHCHILSHEDHEMMRPYEVLESVSPGTPALPGTKKGKGGKPGKGGRH